MHNQDDNANLILVFSNPVPGQDDEFNEWYDNRHLADMLAVEGVCSARRYEAVTDSLGNPNPHRYLAIYLCDGDLDSIAAELEERHKDGRMPVTESYDISTTVSTVWAPCGPETTAMDLEDS